MSVKDAIFIVGTLLFIPLCGLIAWVVSKIIDRMNDRRDEVEELREKLKTAEDERDGWKETAESTHKLLQAEHERADRLAAMNQGLAEDLAALKAYNPDEIEERLKKIREIKADEERRKQAEKIQELVSLSVLNAQLNVLAGTPVQTAQSILDRQSIAGRWTAAQYGVIGR